MFKLSDNGWWERYIAELNADSDWTKAAKYFSGQIQFNHDKGHSTLAVVAGRAVAAFPDGIPLGAEIEVGGPDEEWQRVLDGKIDWFEALSPGLGRLALSGNTVAAWRYVDVMARAFDAMKRVGKPESLDAASYSPAGKSSGKEINGHYVVVDGVRVY
jgi:putative sterol carrier protein